jgi:hypothetical protein
MLSFATTAGGRQPVLLRQGGTLRLCLQRRLNALQQSPGQLYFVANRQGRGRREELDDRQIASSTAVANPYLHVDDAV